MFFNKNKIIKKAIIVFVITIIIVYIGLTLLKYNINGDDSVPFKITKVTIINTVDGDIQKNENTVTSKWNVGINQSNDFYINLEKNQDTFNGEKISDVRIENIYVEEQPKLGEIKKYMPNSTGSTIITSNKDYEFDNLLIYQGGEQTDYKALQIGNQGGTIIFRIANNNIGNVTINKDMELTHSEELLTNNNISLEDIKFKVSFDVVLTIKDTMYKSTIKVELPDYSIMEKGTTSTEIVNNGEFIFKRI